MEAPAASLDLEDVAPYIAQAGHRELADSVFAQLNRYLRSEERIARATSRLPLGLHGRTRLMYAARVGDVGRCAFLVEHGADVRARDRYGRSALTEAHAFGQDACVEFLRAHGAEDDAPFAGALHASWPTPALAGGAGDDVLALAVLPGGRMVVGHRSGAVRIHVFATGAVAQLLAGHASDVNALASLSHDKLLASASSDGTVRVWRTATGECEAVLTPPRRAGPPVLAPPPILTLAVLRSGWLVSGGYDECATVWGSDEWGNSHLSSSAPFAPALVLVHDDPVRSMAALPCGGLACGCMDGTISLWSQAGHLLATLGRASFGSVDALVLTHDSRLAAGYGRISSRFFDTGEDVSDSVVRVWDVVERATRLRLRGHAPGWVPSLAALPDGGIASGGCDGTLRMWSRDGTDVRILHTGGGGDPPYVWALAYDPQQRMLISGEFEGAVRVWV